MSLLNPKVPLKYPQTHTQSCLPLSNQTSQGYRLSGKEIAVHSLARLPFLIQICTLMVGHGIFLHPFKLSGRERALHGCYVLLSCFLSHIVKRAPSPPPNHVAKALCLHFFHCNIMSAERVHSNRVLFLTERVQKMNCMLLIPTRVRWL